VQQHTKGVVDSSMWVCSKFHTLSNSESIMNIG